MDRRVWRARAQGGYTRVFEIVNGAERSPEIAVNKKVFGEQIARKLNEAYAWGVADSKADHEREAKIKIAELLKEMGHDKAADLVRQAPI
ncbi:hypothetical protein HOU95_gp042 [Streptomyces phage Hiyaa]|jgi:hypothetical protein|uniref:Uncharacterized protein n=1 Tax=Streptomyces phage Hiyaa TaxID=2499072 RepID=A0A3S9U8N7_9CAUD|nr:hypothetical protein HOU95_gp042 [Streptomyces phage Hiyaa]AZS06682.1 hypothetical protein SEA_HIYAA_42 [Streptomyces phage Hiyaa]